MFQWCTSFSKFSAKEQLMENLFDPSTDSKSLRTWSLQYGMRSSISTDTLFEPSLWLLVLGCQGKARKVVHVLDTDPLSPGKGKLNELRALQRICSSVPKLTWMRLNTKHHRLERFTWATNPGISYHKQAVPQTVLKKIQIHLCGQCLLISHGIVYPHIGLCPPLAQLKLSKKFAVWSLHAN